MSGSHSVIFTPEAEKQLVAIYQYVSAEASPAIAERFTASIVDYCEGFDTFPQRGTQRNDLRLGLRIVGYRRRVTIAFAVDTSTVSILGVYYGGQDYEDVLQDDV